MWFAPLFVCLLQDKWWIKCTVHHYPSKISGIWWRFYLFINSNIKDSNSVKRFLKCQKYLFHGYGRGLNIHSVANHFYSRLWSLLWYLSLGVYFSSIFFPGMPTFSLWVTAEDFPLIQTPFHATSCPVFDSLLSSVSSLKASPCFHSVPQTLNLYWLTVRLLWALHLLLSHISGWILADDCFQGRLGQKLKSNSWASCAGLPSARAFGGCQSSPP